tara:strand:+ start:23998 stop:24519 length:522 start_codon:yes stop_codon:yes gene_type:complete
MKISPIILIAILLSSCAPIRVHYDFEKGTDFSNYKTYNYYSDMKTGLSELDTKRFLEALDAKLDVLGITFSETPDFYIDIKSFQYEAAQQNTLGIGLGSGGRNAGGGISFGLPIGQAEMNRQISIDFVDENGKGLFWEAVSESGFTPNASPQNRDAQLNAVVEKMLSQYPPKS